MTAHRRFDQTPRPRRWLRSSLVGSAALALVAAGISSAVAPQAVAASPSLTRYPYLTDSVQTSITVSWATDRSATTGSLAWGPQGSCTANRVAATRTSITVVKTAEYQWSATIPVTPDTTYCYRVFLGSTDLLGADPSPVFTSQVAAGSTAPFSFVVLGDWGQAYAGSANPDQANVMKQVAATDARFAVLTGDTAYPGGGQSEYGDLQQTGSDVSGVFGPSFWAVPGRSLPLFNVTGNHGFTQGAVQVLNWPEANAASGSGGRYAMEPYPSINGSTAKSYPSMWYAFDAGGARFYALTAAWSDSNIGTGTVYADDHDAHWTTASAEYQWLAADLAAHPGGVKFAFWHYPLFAANSPQQPDTYLQGGPGTLQGLLDQYGVSIAFNGHAHGYQRNRADAAGLLTYVVGNGGAAMGKVLGCAPVTLYAIGAGGTSCGSAPVGQTDDHVYGFVRVVVNGGRVTVVPTDELGRTYDVQTYTFGSVGTTDQTPPTAPASVTATAASSSEIDVQWAPSTDDTAVKSYKVYRGGATTPIVTTASTSYADTGLDGSTTYTYRVTAVDTSGNESALSDAASATTPATPPTFTFGATDDATVDASKPTTNAGTSTRITIDNSPVNYALLKFSVAGMPSCTVTRATLRLTVGTSTDDKSVYGGDLFAASSTSWSGSTVTWSTGVVPSGPRVSGVPTAVALGTSYLYDVTPLVQGNGTIGLVLTSTSSDGARFFSSEGGTTAQDPLLTITC
ncbi:MAG TPA: fibronectin type III domain-containing protein [Candidatus Nanopelagicales bacterium]|nr:fibronectin type III domain-containing protein [Candidatus Nanopelagicales bacterium]